MKQIVNTKPLLRGHFHQAMFFIALGALIPLLLRTSNLSEFSVILVYTICSLTLFGISSLYHRINWTNYDRRVLWGKFDHSGIFLMIAGTFTPVCFFGLPAESARLMISVIWSVAVIGIAQSFFFPNTPKWLSSLIYIAVGYLIIPYVNQLKESMGANNLLLIFLGGISYTLGAVCYGLKWPKLKPSVIGYHEVFHLFVNLGAILHFVVINSFIKG